jgi:hypothetical protein
MDDRIIIESGWSRSAGTQPGHQARIGADVSKLRAARGTRHLPVLRNPVITTQSLPVAQPDNKPEVKADKKAAGAVAGCPSQPFDTAPVRQSFLRDNPMASRPFAPGTTFMWMR